MLYLLSMPGGLELIILLIVVILLIGGVVMAVLSKRNR